MGVKTSNYYLRDLKSFCRWMQHERRATSSAVEYLAGKMPSAKAFPKLSNDHSADMLKADLQAAWSTV
ncbi:MAG: hypothetical protein ACP5I8_07090 [Phycisphaerae bacterium]